jgi:hypothetical protein
MATKHFFRFDINELSKNEYGGQLHLSGDFDLIGKMLAQYATLEMQKGQPEPMRVLVSCLHELQQLNGGNGKKIIQTN